MYFAQLGDMDELHPPQKFGRVACEHGASGAGVGVWGVRAPVLLFGVELFPPWFLPKLNVFCDL